MKIMMKRLFKIFFPMKLEGCKKAVDEYFAENNIQIFLSRIDYTGRIAVKQN